MKKLIVNCETGVETYEDLTAEELQEYETNQEKFEAEKVAAAEAAAKRQALLDKLGITEDEARLLLGGN